jgi:hypothetical protein
LSRARCRYSKILLETPVNQYGLMARKHWARWLPTRYAAIQDPDSFFSDLGTLSEERITALALDLAGDGPPGEGYLDKAGRLGEARHRAEQIVLTEDILLPPEPGADPDEEEADLRGPGPAQGLAVLYEDDLQDRPDQDE